MKKIFILVALLFMMTGCGSKSFEVGYSSNMLKEKDREELKTILKDNKVSNVDTFISWLEDYNKDDDKNCGMKDWIKTSDLVYDDVACVERYEKNHDVSDGNCRLTAFTLISDLLSINKTLKNNGTYLMLDDDVLETNANYKLVSDQYDKFVTIYGETDISNVKKEDIKNVFNKKWTDNGIKINSNTVSLISIVMHDNIGNILFVGHTGVLIELSDKLIFIEKIAFELPYQVSVFKTRDELKEMIFSRTNYFADGTEEGPFIYENDKLIYEYK